MKTLIICAFLFSSVSFAQKKQNASSKEGRFQLIQLSDFRRDQFLLDTETGKIWTRVCSISEGSECEIGAWSPDYIIGITISEADYLKRVSDLRKFIQEQKKGQ